MGSVAAIKHCNYGKSKGMRYTNMIILQRPSDDPMAVFIRHMRRHSTTIEMAAPRLATTQTRSPVAMKKQTHHKELSQREIDRVRLLIYGACYPVDVFFLNFVCSKMRSCSAKFVTCN